MGIGHNYSHDFTNNSDISDTQRYFAFVGDVRSPSNRSEHEECKKKLLSALDEINKLYSRDLALRFTPDLGDEFQGLLLNGSSVMAIVNQIMTMLSPYHVRLGIGFGRVMTSINSGDSVKYEGPALTKAREAMNELKSLDVRNRVATGCVLIHTDDPKDEFINKTLKLMYAISLSWSARQRTIISDMLLHRDSQKTVAQRYGTTQPTVQKALASGNYYAFQESYDLIERFFRKM